ncbi:MAG: helix-turn-helix transcriptional regulator, partial [Coriobacteriales bacterium]|nr:helix-turn-helix transcriptional regulator [Coriobacteriales bacterium]
MATKTGELNKRQLQALETKRLLLETGRALIAERGIEHVTAEDIVSVAGVAKGTFFFHFGSMGNFIMSLSKMNEP